MKRSVLLFAATVFTVEAWVATLRKPSFIVSRDFQKISESSETIPPLSESRVIMASSEQSHDFSSSETFTVLRKDVRDWVSVTSVLAASLFFFSLHGSFGAHHVEHLSRAEILLQQVRAGWHCLLVDVGVLPKDVPMNAFEAAIHKALMLAQSVRHPGHQAIPPLGPLETAFHNAASWVPHMNEPTVSKAAAQFDLSALSPQRAVNAYQQSLREHYAATTALQAFILVGLGDFGAQLIELGKDGNGNSEELTGGAVPSFPSQQMVELETAELASSSPRAVGEAQYDAVRTLRMALLGLLIGGVGTSNWLRFLEGQIPGHDSIAPVLEKATLDACVWAPLANTAYLVLTPLLEGKPVQEVQSLLEAEFAGVMKTELMTFFPYNIVSFSLVPPLLRPFTTGFISMCFSIYISVVTHSNDGNGNEHSGGGLGDEPEISPVE